MSPAVYEKYRFVANYFTDMFLQFLPKKQSSQSGTVRLRRGACTRNSEFNPTTSCMTSLTDTMVNSTAVAFVAAAFASNVVNAASLMLQ